MLSTVWGILIFSSLFFGIITGNISNVSSSVSSGATEAVTLIISISGVICFWSGIMEILKESGLLDLVSKILTPILKLLFKKASKDKKSMQLISANFTANLLGLSNAATPMGLLAVERMHKKGYKKDVLMLIIINCSSIQLLPTTVSAIRQSYGAKNPFDIIICVWITSILSVLSGVFIAKICERFAHD